MFSVRLPNRLFYCRTFNYLSQIYKNKSKWYFCLKEYYITKLFRNLIFVLDLFCFYVAKLLPIPYSLAYSTI